MGVTRSTIHEANPDNLVKFGQDELADQITDQIKKDPNIHIAVNGPWGSGKTTVLERTEEKFTDDNSDIITVWYEPWRYGPDQTTLRRTFLKTLDEEVANEIEKDPLLDSNRYHFSNSDIKRKSVGEFLGDFWTTLRATFSFIFVFSVLMSIIFITGLTLFILEIHVVITLLSMVLLGLSYFLFTSLMVYLRDDLGSELASTTTFEVKEPKISEIDLFEEKYKDVLKRASKEDKQIVVFIDDIDRCSNREIREVITGLSTYLNPSVESVEIGFVTAIDDRKVINVFQSNQNERAAGPNIINKTFQTVIPVPTLSRENIVELVDTTTQELDYDISDADAERIATDSVAYANSNLRTIRSAICEAQWMKKLGAEYLQNSGHKNSQSFNTIMDSDSILYRIALIRTLSNNDSLRKYVTDASMWINGEKHEGIEWGLFDLQPEFKYDGLDPRPFLALNSPSDSVAGVDDLKEIRKDTKKENSSQVLELCEKYDSPTKLNICYNLLDRDLDSMSTDVKSSHINVIIELMVKSLDTVDSSSYPLFNSCINAMSKDRKVVNNIDRTDYPKWLTIADRIGDKALDDLFDMKSAFLREDKNKFLRKMAEEATEYREEICNRILEIEIEEASSSPRNSSRRMTELYESDIIEDVEKAPEYILEVIKEWDYEKRPSGPKDSLLAQEIVDRLHNEEYKQEAGKLYSTTVPSGTEIKEKMYELNWPEPKRSEEEEPQEVEGEE